MKASFFVAFIFALVLSTSTVEGRIFLDIDTFSDLQLPTILVASGGGDLVAPYDWWSPYYVAYSGSGGAPQATFFDTPSAVGGQRDSVLGYESATPTNSVAVISIVGNAASVAFPLKYVGGAYFQWDGDDAAGGATAFPGAIFNTLPGLGSGEPDSIDGQTIDFTYGGRAAGIFIEVTADHDVFYFMDCLDSFGVENTYAFVVEIVDEDSVVQFFFRFDDPTWDTPAFDFSDVAGFQVRIFTFSDGVLAGADNAIDTEFRFLRIFGFEVSGNVVIDCLCDQSTAVSPVFNERINLFNFGNPTIIDFVFTDVTGFYLFNDQSLLLNGNDYTVCLDNQVQPMCVTSNPCIDFSLINFVDVTNLDFDLTAVTVLSIPNDVTVDCGDCTDPVCTGFATVSGCGTGSIQLNTFTDFTTTDGCTSTISRTWTDPDTLQSGIQIITIVDNIAPVIFQSASDRTQTCDIASTYFDWINTQAGADATDCLNFSWSASPNSAPFQCDFEIVTFTATDACGNSASTTATYTVTDFVDPIWNPLSSSQSVECDLKTSSNTNSMNSWRNTFGGGIATDNCSSSGALQFTDDFIGFAPDCFASETVIFIATDACGNFASTTSSFTISDNLAPVITQQPANLNIDCGVSGGPQNALDNWLLIRGGAQATDQCISNDNNLSWSNDFVGSLGTCSDSGVVTFTVTDDCFNSAFATASYTLSDSTPPTFTATATNLNSQCDGLGNISAFNTWIADNAGARATDNCGSVSFTNNNNGPPIDCGDSVVVTFTATDSCSLLSVDTTASFTIIDNTPPVFDILPSSQSSECSSTSSAEFDSWLAASAFASISDVCSSTGTFISNDFSGNTLNPGCLVTQSVRFFANDPCGNVSTPQTAVFTISDTLSPTIFPEASSQVVECNLSTNQADYQNFLSTRGGALATDQCASIVSFTHDGGPIQSGCDNSVTVTFTANDGCGHTDQTTASFGIVDTTFPVLVNNAADLTVECNGSGNANDLNNWLNSNGGASATDSCTSVIFTNDFIALSGGCTSSAFVTFEGCDSCGHCVTSSATFTINDNSSPIINPQASGTTVECDPLSNDSAFDTFVANRGGASASDVCEDDADLIWTSSFTASPFGCDSEVVTFTVSDTCGRTASTTATFTIFDTISPTITVPAASVSVECDGSGNTNDYNNFVATRSGADAVDVCAFSLTWVNNAPVSGPVGCGTQAITFTVEDECLNSSSTTATYTVVDTAGPTIITPAANQSVQCTDTNSNLTTLETWLSTQGGAFASDSCYAANFVWTNNFVNLNFDGCNEFAEVTFTATDPCGSFSITTATFTIIDTVPPVFTEVATNAIFECSDIDNPNDINNYLALHGNSVATDLCSGVIFTNDFVTGPLECGPAVPITFTATDACGNFASTTGSIAIDDSVDPTFSFFPLDIVLGCDQDIDPETAGLPVVFDACDADITPTFTDAEFKEPDEGFCPGDLITTRTWFVVDDCGNAHQRDQIITTVFALSSGPCTPTQCPPCELDQCCEIVPDRIQCNAVPCNVVSCTSVPCDTVPCLPNVECQDITYTDDDDNTLPPIPVPSFLPVPSCEPVYIYVFDDDETNINGPGNPIVPDYESESSASSLKVSIFMALIFAILSLF